MGLEKDNLASDSFTEIWSSSFEEIADAYLPGTFDFLEGHRPKLYEDIALAEETVNEDWKEKRMVAFKIDTKDWQKLMKQGIEQFERERMHVPKEEKPFVQDTRPKPKQVGSETPRRKNFFEVFQEMKAKEKF